MSPSCHIFSCLILMDYITTNKLSLGHEVNRHKIIKLTKPPKERKKSVPKIELSYFSMHINI